MAVPVIAVAGPLWLLTVPFFLLQLALGFVMGNTTALALRHARDVAGTASAVVGGLNFLFGAAMSAVAGLLGSMTAVPLGVLMSVGATAACLAFLWTRRIA